MTSHFDRTYRGEIVTTSTNQSTPAHFTLAFRGDLAALPVKATGTAPPANTTSPAAAIISGF